MKKLWANSNRKLGDFLQSMCFSGPSFLGMLLPIAAGFVELTNGILRLTPDRRGFVTAAALLGWGGLSVHCQTAAVTAGSGISLRLYVPAKAVQAALSAGLAALLAPYLLP